mmetsp:Transcript_7434/g.16851  ORF Transcript_7434/g.16851 Transcript_7434/m.16851 type:complete len:243 (-) Transcript_7434:27-755(-)
MNLPIFLQVSATGVEKQRHSIATFSIQIVVVFVFVLLEQVADQIAIFTVCNRSQCSHEATIVGLCSLENVTCSWPSINELCRKRSQSNDATTLELFVELWVLLVEKEHAVMVIVLSRLHGNLPCSCCRRRMNTACLVLLLSFHLRSFLQGPLQGVLWSLCEVAQEKAKHLVKGQIWICLFLRFLDPVLHSDHLCKRAEMLATLLALEGIAHGDLPRSSQQRDPPWKPCLRTLGEDLHIRKPC